MDNPTDTLDQADEEILTYTVSDEALEAAAGTENPSATLWPFCHTPTSDCEIPTKNPPTAGR
jgi:hypothetical protein